MIIIGMIPIVPQVSIVDHGSLLEILRFSLLLLISRDFTTAPHRFTVWHGRHYPNHCDRQTYNEVKVSGVTEVQYYSFPSRQRTNRCVRRFSFFSMQYVKKESCQGFFKLLNNHFQTGACTCII